MNTTKRFSTKIDESEEEEIADPATIRSPFETPERRRNFHSQVEAGDRGGGYLEDRERKITDFAQILDYIPEILSKEETNNIQEEVQKVELQSEAKAFTKEDKVIFSVIRENRTEPEKIWRILETEGLLKQLSNRHTYPFMRTFANHPEELEWKTKLFDNLTSNTSASPNCYHEVICVNAKFGNLQKATELYNALKESGQEPHIETISYLTSQFSKSIPELCAKGEIDQVRLALREIHDNGLIASPEIYTLIVETYIAHSKFEQASDVLSKAAQRGHNLSRNVYKSLILAHISNGNSDRAKWVLDDMEADNIYVPRELSNLVSQALIAGDQTKLASELKSDIDYRSAVKILSQQIEKNYSIN